VKAKTAGQIRLNAAVTALVACIAVILLNGCGNGNPRVNILLVVVDTLRADHLGCYGYDRDTSPNIDRLAEKSVQFTRYYSVVPTTLASFASLLTSLHPKDHGAFRNGYAPDDSLPVLGNVFRRAGYDTAAFVSSYCLSKTFGMDRGFDHFDEEFTSSTMLRDNKLVRSAWSVTRSFSEWVNRRQKNKPFFVMLHYFDPHWPYDPPLETMKLFGAREQPGNPETPDFPIAQKNLAASGGLPGSFEKNLHNLYCAEIRYVDQQFGKVIELINDSGLSDDTVVVFTSDHGETFWEHDDHFNHGRFVYDTTIRLPLLISFPSGQIAAPRRCDGLFCNIDLGPTLLDIAEIEAPSGFQGQSFAELLLGSPKAAPTDNPLFSEATQPIAAERGAARPNLLKAKCVRRGPWKFISFPGSKGRKELYNMEDDPLETENLIDRPETADIALKLEAILEQWATSYKIDVRRANSADDDSIDKLNELGY